MLAMVKDLDVREGCACLKTRRDSLCIQALHKGIVEAVVGAAHIALNPVLTSVGLLGYAGVLVATLRVQTYGALNQERARTSIR